MPNNPAARLTFARLCITALIALASSGVDAQQGNSNLVFVLDGSGSMWGRVDGQMKIVEAKDVMGELLADVPDGVDVGLVVYGHRRKGDCSDIETLAGLGTSPETVATQVQKVSPKGKTPITASLQQAADLLTGKEGRSTLVLVSDGLETCEGDPCALAKKLRAEGIELRIHTIGFGVGDSAAMQLQCIAEAGGGNYYHASNGEALRESLFAVREAVASAEPPPPPPEALAPPKVETKTTRVTIAGPGTIVLEPAPWVKMPPHEWQLLDAETGEKLNATKEKQIRVKAGEYQLAWQQMQWVGIAVPLTAAVTVESRQTVKVPVDTGFRLTVPEGIGEPHRWSLRPIDAVVPAVPSDRAISADRGDVAFFKSLDPQVVPAGRFRLLWKEDEFAAWVVDLGVVDVLPGRLNEYVADSGLVLQGADWINGDPYHFKLVDADGKVYGGWRTGWGPHLAPPGRYELQYRQTEYAHGMTRWGPVEIGEHGMTAVAIDSGVKFVPEGDVPVPYMITFVDLATGEEIFWKISDFGSWDPVPLPPGRYRIDWKEQQYGTDRMTVLDELEVPASTLVEIGI